RSGKRRRTARRSLVANAADRNDPSVNLTAVSDVLGEEADPVGHFQTGHAACLLAVVVIVRIEQRDREDPRTLPFAIGAIDDLVGAVVPARAGIFGDQRLDAVDRGALLVARLLHEGVAPVINRVVAVRDIPAVVVAAGIVGHR